MIEPCVLSIGCHLPIGTTPEDVLTNVRSGKCPGVQEITCSDGRHIPVFQANPPDEILRHPRLRRSSRISHLACAAAKNAVDHAPDWNPARSAIVFAASNGAVIYTRQFFDGVVREGTGSPLFFPETVYNAPASHVAALVGIDGEVVTLVSDATAAIDALATATEILESPDLDTCLVVAAEEVDPVTAAAYRLWGLIRDGADGHSEATLSEGAVAMVLGRDGGPRLRRLDTGHSCTAGHSLRRGLDQVVKNLTGGHRPDVVVCSAAGARSDATEALVLDERLRGVPRLTPNRMVGQAFAVSALTQVLVAAQVILQNEASSALVPVVGWNGRVGGLVLTADGAHA